MKIRVKIRVVALASVMSFFAGFSWCGAAPSPAFRPVLHDLVGHTSIPILLPSWLPSGSSGRWAEAHVAADSYDVSLPNELEYRLKRPHDWHDIQAHRIVNGERFFPGTPVRLSGGRIGCYQSEEENAGARPGNACVSWVQDGVEYAVLEYAGDRANVIRMANSVVVIRGGLPPLLRRALPKLRATGVRPVLLPTYLPPLEGFLWGRTDIKPDMDVIADSTSYQVAYSSRPDVDEADMAYFQADPIDQYSGPLDGRPVTLLMPSFGPGNRRLSKVPVRAGYRAVNPKDSASTAGISWDIGRTRYTLIWLGGSRTQMIRMAESCVPVAFDPVKGTGNAKK